MQRRQLHVITPGDHFSPSTGSALPTVVHGLAGATPPGGVRPAVVVARGTYPDRYASADVIEYDAVPHGRFDRYLDAGLSRLGAPRAAVRREFAATVADQSSWEPSVILGHNAPQLVPAIDAERHAAVLYAHNDVLRTYSRREAGRVLERADAIISVSHSLAGQLAESLPDALHERLHVVHNGVDTDVFHPRADGERGERLRVAFVGRVIRDKGPDVLLDALTLLDRADIGVTIIGGAGFAVDAPLTPYEQSLRRLGAPLGDRFATVPFAARGETARLLRDVDVLVVPSRWRDPFALTVLEGMASGAAVVASDIGGIPEAAGGAGILVPPDDARALADAIAALADDESLRRRTALAGLEHARASTWAVARAALDDALLHALEGRS
jgi:glycosyltransferase involved in cell wall biosynthesis